MKVVDQKVWLDSQNLKEGWVGMFKHIEKCGRVSWRSEDKIDENSWKKFVKFLYGRGHWAVFNLGTAYLRVPAYGSEESRGLVKLNEEPWTKMAEYGSHVYVTTNFRVLCQLGLEDWVQKFWYTPDDPRLHEKRVTVGWKCSRVISEEILRHSVLRPCKESTRYLNYTKNGKEVEFIIPQYAYELRDEIAQTVDSLTGESKSWIKNLEGEKLWRALTVESRWASSRDDLWRNSEDQYRYEILEEEVAPEIARGVLGLDLACTFYTTGYLKDFFYEPPIESPEKAGFFKLRCAPDCHRDLRKMATELKQLMIDKEYDEEWKKFGLPVV